VCVCVCVYVCVCVCVCVCVYAAGLLLIHQIMSHSFHLFT
jgi:hypothetical protein